MLRTIKRVTLSALSILFISFLFWTLFLLNPSWSYANETHYEFVTVYHNEALEANTEQVIKAAINIIKNSELFDKDISIQLCMNDDAIYPNLHALVGDPLAYALLDKTIIKNCTISFDKNIAETKWPVNNYEYRKFDLTYLLAHEFSHNLQFNADTKYVIKTTLGTLNWKLEGHAEYIARQFKNDGQLKEKIAKYLEEAQKEHNGLPVFELADGTKQILSYFKNALVVQYLMEQKEMNFSQVCALDKGLDEVYTEMIEWSKK